MSDECEDSLCTATVLWYPRLGQRFICSWGLAAVDLRAGMDANCVMLT